MSKTFLALAVGAAAVAVVALGATLPAASTRAPAPWTSEYRPVQSITQEFGSKVASGYFLARDGACAVTLMVGERSDPEAPHALSAARLRVTLAPGQAVGLDSDEGRSLSLACGAGGKTLTVDSG
ncbi:MAG: hypothetical protein ACM35H_14770, partial [Bacteroidota bacterium]